MAELKDVVTLSEFPKKLWLKQILLASAKYDPVLKLNGETILTPGVASGLWNNKVKDSLSVLYNFVRNFEKWNPQGWEKIDDAFSICSNNINYILFDNGKYYSTIPNRKQLVLAVLLLIIGSKKQMDDTAASVIERQVFDGYDFGHLIIKNDLLKSGIQTVSAPGTRKTSNKNDGDFKIDDSKYNKTRGHTSSNVKSSRMKRKDREYYSHTNHLSPYVRDLLSAPNSPIAMTGENGHIFAIEQATDSSTSSKTPMALIMPLTNVSKPNTLRRTANINGVIKNKVRVSASVDSPQTFIIFFNTLKEAQEMLDKIIQTAYVPERIASGVDITQLRVVAYNILSKDTHQTQKEWEKFKHLFYQVDTDLGPAWIMAYHLNEEFKRTGEINMTEVFEEDNVKPAQTSSYFYDFDSYEEAFNREF